MPSNGAIIGILPLPPSLYRLPFQERANFFSERGQPEERQKWGLLEKHKVRRSLSSVSVSYANDARRTTLFEQKTTTSVRLILFMNCHIKGDLSAFESQAPYSHRKTSDSANLMYRKNQAQKPQEQGSGEESR
jgi:hypothetical protein